MNNRAGEWRELMRSFSEREKHSFFHYLIGYYGWQDEGCKEFQEVARRFLIEKRENEEKNVDTNEKK